ncbi:hypothetical protein Tco_1515549 [Tanacetum coccineum]
MTTLAEFMIIASTDNRPPMLEKSLYDYWKSRMKFYMENRENGRMNLDSVQNGPLVWPTVTQEDGTTRKKTYAELSATEKRKFVITRTGIPVQVNTKFLNSLPTEMVQVPLCDGK